jgi:hypothetical protein
MKRFVLLLVLVLACVSGAYAQSIQYTDDFTSPTLNPWWNATVEQSGYITYPSSYLGVPCVEFDCYGPGTEGYTFLVHNFSAPVYGDTSVSFYYPGVQSAADEWLRVTGSDNGLPLTVYFGGAGWHTTEIDDTPTSWAFLGDGAVLSEGAGGFPIDSIEFGIDSYGTGAPASSYFDGFSFNGEVASAPEPGTLALLGAALLGLGVVYLRRRRAKA